MLHVGHGLVEVLAWMHTAGIEALEVLAWRHRDSPGPAPLRVSVLGLGPSHEASIGMGPGKEAWDSKGGRESPGKQNTSSLVPHQAGQHAG